MAKKHKLILTDGQVGTILNTLEWGLGSGSASSDRHYQRIIDSIEKQCGVK